MAVRMGAEKSSFSLTYNLLSQYLREKGSLADLNLGFNRPSEPKARTETMDLLPSLELVPDRPVKADAAPRSGEDVSRQLTIFYHGKVMVFDNFPADKANELFAMVARGRPNPTSSTSSSETPVMTSNSNKIAPATSTPVLSLPLATASDLPIARRASLNRFLEKRKDRISSTAPYQLSTPQDVGSENSPLLQPLKAEERKPWLGLAPSKPEETL